jgi:polysaccharide biosynthesis/export protein
MIKSWEKAFLVMIPIFILAGCTASNGPAIRQLNPVAAANPEGGKETTPKQLPEGVLERTPPKEQNAKETDKEKSAESKERTFVRVNAEVLSMKEYLRGRFPGKKVVFPDELKQAKEKLEYRIGKDDVLHMFIWGHPDLTMDLTVRKDGQLSVPLIGNIAAEGLTIPELEKRVQVGMERFIQNPQISINTKEVNSLRIFIVGQVRKLVSTTGLGVRPDFLLKGGGTLLDALSDVEFYSDADLVATYVTRDDMIIPINLKALLKDGDLSQNIRLQPDDRVVVPPPYKEITILGEVGGPGKYKVNIDTTLADIISIARGFNRETADLYMAYVARNKQVLPVNLKRLFDYGDQGQNIIMEDLDVVYIPNNNEKKFFVLGEVVAPKVIYYRDPVDVIEALTQAGGFTSLSANWRQVVVVRGDVRNPQIYEIDAKSLMEGKSMEKFIMQKGDILYVPRMWISDWNLFIARILPTITTVDLIDTIKSRH